ncbi:MAG: FAD-binding oxidoreductase [Crenarchaeota archaeon]|nr:FAD-binding oxidoreductase [Thermoproteota archaeon]
MRVCVVGCGVVGSFLSLFLKERGVDVTAISRRRRYPRIGLIQSIMQKHPADIYAARRTRELYLEISRRYNIDDVLTYVRSYTVVRKEKEEHVDKLVEQWKKNGVSIEKLERDSLKEIPFKHYEDEIIYLCTNDTIVRIDKLIDKIWNIVNVKKHNVEIKGSIENVKIYVDGRELKKKFDKIVICCGSWTRSLLRKVGITLPLLPYKCQAGLFALSTRDSNYILYDYVNKTYVRPCGELSKLRIGREKLMVAGNGNTPPMEPEEKAEVEPWFADEIIPKLRRRFEKVRYLKGSAGFCDTTPDARPIIASFGSLIAVSGFDGYGAEIGPAVAEIACKVILDEPLNELERSFLVDRFGTGVEASSLPEVEAHEL